MNPPLSTVILKLLISVIALVFLSAAFGEPKSDIVGKWIETGTGDAVEYKHDGTFERKSATGDLTRGNYHFVDAAHIIVEFENNLMPMGAYMMPVTVTGDDLDTTEEGGKKPKKYHRIKNDKPR